MIINKNVNFFMIHGFWLINVFGFYKIMFITKQFNKKMTQNKVILNFQSR